MNAYVGLLFFSIIQSRPYAMRYYSPHLSSDYLCQKTQSRESLTDMRKGLYSW